MRASLPTLLTVAFCSSTAWAQEPSTCGPTSTCVDNQDLKLFLRVLREKKCLQEQKPDLKLDPIEVTVDRQGRVFGSGSQPKPYRVRMTWCGYEVEAQGNTKIYAAEMETPKWGFRFRPKAAVGFLPATAVKNKSVTDGIDGGLLFESFFYHWLNINAYVGVRSVGGGVGLDLTKNFGGYLGYAITWGDWVSNPFVGVSFAFW